MAITRKALEYPTRLRTTPSCAMYFLEGPGRKTPYVSTSEQYDLAENFAKAGAVWKVYVQNAQPKGVNHINKFDLLAVMKGNRKGKAKWPESYDVMQARRYVEQ